MGSEDGLMSGNEERIYVSVRLRPLNENEILRNDVADWECINDRTIVFKNAGLSASEKSMYPTAYTFDRVFRSDCSTKEVYENGARHIAVSVVNGINSSVFAYGQTSSGKTYTMTGLTEFALADIYDCIKRLPEREFVLKFSAMEIYNESVRDLLSVDTTPLRLLDDPTRGTIVKKLTEEILKDWDHVVHLLSMCEAQRQFGETSLNEMSSRSHQIIRLTIESSSREFLGRGSATTLTATMNFVDLAGSERASQSLSAGTRLKEGCHINRSLLTLGTVIRKLSKSRSGHIPYRDSKLTRILQTSLGGNAKTAIICTMSPARSHVEQSRNTLLFASCAKEVTTSARVNVVMSDKALVKHLQREIVRLETELRSPRSSFTPSDYSAVLREKDRQIDKLEEEINDLILQRDIAQSQVKDLLRILGNDTERPLQVGYGNYPHLRVHESPENDLRSSILSDSQSVEINTRACSGGHSRSSSLGHIVKVPYFEGNLVNTIESPRIFTSTPSERYSYHRWEDIEKRSSPTSEDLCREVQCIEIRESSEKSVTKENTEVDVSEDEQNLEFRLSPTLDKDQVLQTTRLESRDEIMNNSNESQENESSCDKEKENRSTARFPTKKSFENPSLSIPERAINQPISRALRLTKSRSCRASITEPNSPWLKTINFIENSPFFDPGREASGFKKNLSPLSSEMAAKTVSRKDSQSSPGNALDSEIDSPIVKFPNPQVLGSTNGEVYTNELSVEHIFVKNQSDEIMPKTGEAAKKNVKDVGLDPIEYEPKDPSTWPTEFQRLQREIIELWHECHVSLIHRAYFFVLFRGDSSDAIYLEMEMRRLKFLKQRFSLGEKTTMNGKCLTLSSSEKGVGEERRMLSQRMMRKLSEQERESLFVKWGIGLNTKLRRLQLANRLWTKTDDMDHVSDSAYLVAKLVGTVEPGHTHNKEMFGLNLTPRSSTRTYSLKRSLISFL